MSLWQLLLNNPEWALVAVGIVTAIVISWQSFQTKRAANAAFQSVSEIQRQAAILERQAKATENAANAAIETARTTAENVALIIAKERARISIKVKDLEWHNPILPPSHFSPKDIECEIEFFGYTTATIKDSGIIAFADDDPYPVSSKFTFSRLLDNGIIAPPKTLLGSTPIWPFPLEKTVAEAIRDCRCFVHLVAFIDYIDAFGKQRRTSIKCRWEEGMIPGMAGTWRTYGSPEENDAT